MTVVLGTAKHNLSITYDLCVIHRNIYITFILFQLTILISKVGCIHYFCIVLVHWNHVVVYAIYLFTLKPMHRSDNGIRIIISSVYLQTTNKSKQKFAIKNKKQLKALLLLQIIEMTSLHVHVKVLFVDSNRDPTNCKLAIAFQVYN